MWRAWALFLYLSLECRPFNPLPARIVSVEFTACGFASSSKERGQVRNVRLQAGLREPWSSMSRWCVEQHAQYLPAALIPHLYAPSPPVWAIGNEGYRLFDDPDGVAMGSQPVRKLDTFVIEFSSLS